MRIAIVIPVLNEEAAIGGTLCALVPMLSTGDEIVVVDGGGTDRTCEVVRDLRLAAVQLIEGCERGRGSQQARGAAESTAEILWFVHADTLPDSGCMAAIRKALADRTVAGGNFALRFTGSSGGARFMNRSYPWLRLLKLYYGDSAIFLRRECYEAAGGFRDRPIFEDLDLIARLKGTFVHLDPVVTTSSRRFEGRWFPGVFLHWTLLQILYWAGVPPVVLGRWYAAIR